MIKRWAYYRSCTNLSKESEDPNHEQHTKPFRSCWYNDGGFGDNHSGTWVRQSVIWRIYQVLPDRSNDHRIEREHYNRMQGVCTLTNCAQRSVYDESYWPEEVGLYTKGDSQAPVAPRTPMSATLYVDQENWMEMTKARLHTPQRSNVAQASPLSPKSPLVLRR